MRRLAITLLGLGAVASPWLGGCGESAPAGEQPADDAAITVAVHPPVIGLDTRVQVAIEASRSTLSFDRTELELGEGITVEGVTVQDGWGAIAEVIVAPDAALGPRDAVVRSGSRSWTLPDAITVVPESIAITPDTARLGQLLTVEVTGRDTAFGEGTWASFGDGVQVVDVEVHDPERATVTVSVRPDATPGRQDVSMENGPERVTLYDGFTIDRAAVTAVFDPPEVWQGSVVSFRIDGRDTTFLTGTEVPGDTGGVTVVGASDVQFWDGGGRNADITLLEVEVEDADTISGVLQVSNAAALGSRDVFVTGFEDLLIPDALEVRDSPPDLNLVAVGLGFDVEREIDPVTGAVEEEVEAFAYFIIPLIPPCVPPPTLPPPSPSPYDVNVAGEVPEPPEPPNCPNPETVSAGEVVWLEGPNNTVTLYKELIESTGQIIYLSRDLTLSDYHFGTWYDLHTQGDPSGVPEVLLQDVQPTVPADFTLTSPTLWGGATHPRAQDLTFTWTPAQTYPVAFFGASLAGTWESSGLGGTVAAIPWDDGAHTFTAAELSGLAPGPVVFSAEVEIDGPRFGLPDSVIQTNQADSVVSVSGTLELQ